MAVPIAPPPGFVLDNPDSIPALPAGFTIDTPQSSTAVTYNSAGFPMQNGKYILPVGEAVGEQPNISQQSAMHQLVQQKVQQKLQNNPKYVSPEMLAQQVRGNAETPLIAAWNTLSSGATEIGGFIGAELGRLHQYLMGQGLSPQESADIVQKVTQAAMQKHIINPINPVAQENLQKIGEIDQQLTPIAGLNESQLLAESGQYIPKPALVEGKSLPSAIKSSNINPAASRAISLGYKVLPNDIRTTGVQDATQASAGTVPLKQMMSVHNQNNTNLLAKAAIGYPQDEQLTVNGLNNIRAEAGKAYDPVKKFGNIETDQQFKDQLNNIGNIGSEVTNEMPALVNKDVQQYVNEFNKPNFSSAAIVDGMKRLRQQANKNYMSTDPNALDLANAQKKISNALEDLLIRKMGDSPLVQNLINARQTIAKTYTLQKVLKENGNIDARALGKMLNKGDPLSGNLKDIAEFGQNFKNVSQVNPPQVTNFRPMDLVLGLVAGHQNPLYASAVFARPAMRSLLMSKFYQNRLAGLTMNDIENVSSLPESMQVSAMKDILNKKPVSKIPGYNPRKPSAQELSLEQRGVQVMNSIKKAIKGIRNPQEAQNIVEKMTKEAGYEPNTFALFRNKDIHGRVDPNSDFTVYNQKPINIEPIQ